jgi:hypothetical protein
MLLALRAGPATASCPTTHNTTIAIGITYQASGVSENACTMKMFKPTARIPPATIGRTKRSTDANLASAASNAEACETNQPEACYGRQERDYKRQYLDHGSVAQVGELTYLIHGDHVTNDAVLVAAGQ